jgi:hypothetical protein
MKYLKFKNNGEIQLEAITLLEASTKRTDNNILYFDSNDIEEAEKIFDRLVLNFKIV